MTPEESVKVVMAARPYGEEAWKRGYAEMAKVLNTAPDNRIQTAVVAFIAVQALDLLLSSSHASMGEPDRNVVASHVLETCRQLCERFAEGSEDTDYKPFHKEKTGHA